MGVYLLVDCCGAFAGGEVGELRRRGGAEGLDCGEEGGEEGVGGEVDA